MTLRDLKMTEQRKPKLYVIAGPNGAGKTTFANRFLPDFVGCKHFVNADLIAAGLSPFSPELAAVEAGRLILKRMDELARQKVDFGFETTLAIKTLIKRLKNLKGAGYKIHLVYLWIESPELSITRVAERVKKGGHHVPDETVRRRYYAGLRNLFSVYMPLVDYLTIYDNSGTVLVRISHGSIAGLKMDNEALFVYIKGKARNEKI